MYKLVVNVMNKLQNNFIYQPFGLGSIPNNKHEI